MKNITEKPKILFLVIGLFLALGIVFADYYLENVHKVSINDSVDSNSNIKGGVDYKIELEEKLIMEDNIEHKR